MPRPDRSCALDHVVVLMFENRSFDNLLGRLYQPGEVPAFDGVTGLDLACPVPDWAAVQGGPTVVPYGVATNMNTPNPDPGEEYEHVNTQLFSIIDPPSNRGVLAQKMTAPYNAPPDHGQRPAMDGFVTDYISAFTAEMQRPPSYDEYAQIMTGYTPEQMPVLSALARGFATFDHWFCEVPSQTFANRSFFHAASSSGYVDNLTPAASFPVHNTAETIFERLDQQGLSWKVYCDPPSHLSLTGIIHAPRLWPHFATKFVTTDQFLLDAADGNLPTYSFIEPNLLYGHNDMHPAFDALFPDAQIDPPSSLLGGEALLAQIYDAVRSSASDGGSNAWNTLLLITFDEHGGTYDHVPPPLAPPPNQAAPFRQFGFGFDRSGIRVPTIAISPWIGAQTVITDEYRSTSVIATLRERWQLGSPLTGRDAVAADLTPVLSLDAPRDPADWPSVTPRPVPPFEGTVPAPGSALRGLCKAAVHSCLALAEHMGKDSPQLSADEDLTRAEGVALISDMGADAFPRLHHD
ncbi:MAG TPA: alkaline phosphatase family protein [Streptosporangiaceae bacterium]|nr:alkaline phosphatase family protein [Streptosporangiaceae bacterium]